MSKGNNHIPPRWANRFLEWYCRPELLEEIQRDVYELYERKAIESEYKARLQFIWNVLRFFRWKNIHKNKIIYSSSSLSPAMFKSYLITGFRNMLRNATPSFINITGLALAIGCAVLIFIILDSYYNLDSMHVNGKRIAMVVNHVKEGDRAAKFARSPAPLADLLRENSAVEKVARAARSTAAVRVGDNVNNELILFADPEFMDIFSFNTLSGNRKGLAEKGNIMISQQMAIKYFGHEHVVGQTLSMKLNDTYKQEFTIAAVLENTPANSSIYFDFLVPAEVWNEMMKPERDDWHNHNSVTFVMLYSGKDFNQLETSLSAYKKIQNESKSTRKLEYAELVPLFEVAQRSFEYSGALSWSNAPAAMVAFVVIAVFLLLLACFNYMNVSVATVSTRLKEIGIRKVIGGGRKEIIHQFLIENFVLCSLALLMGTALAYLLLVPGFDSLYPVKIEFAVSSWPMVFGFFGFLLIFISLVSGAYPALYVSSFNAVYVLKGKEKFGNKSFFSKVLLSLQFILSITIMVACFIFAWSGYYFNEKDWGYNKENILVVPLQSARQYEELKSELANNSSIINYGGAGNHIGKWNKEASVRYNDNDYTVTYFEGSANYPQIMNLRLLEGRYFEDDSETDKQESVLVNQAFAKKLGWENALGQSFEYDSAKRYVIGVIEDFYFRDFYYSVEPVMLLAADESKFLYFASSIQAGSSMQADEAFRNAWKSIAPDDPYRGFFQDEVFENFIRSNESNNKVIFFIAGVAIFLAAMGLYGLVSYNLTRRLKEFSVRKVFGASILQIFRLMNKDYLAIVLIAFAVGAPLGAYLIDLLLKAAYPEPIPVSYWPYLISSAIMILTVAITMLTQLRRVITENPTETLQSE